MFIEFIVFSAKLRRALFCAVNYILKLFLGQVERRKLAFSLVEMLMALLVASLLMVSLAPVMTKKFNETISIGGGNQFVHEVAYNSPYCPVGAEPKTYDDGTEYCEGEFTVPMGVNKIEVTLVGGGGGGAAALTAGYSELYGLGSSFKAPPYVDELETTIVTSGAGGGSGGYALKNVTFVASGKGGVTTEDALNIVEEVPAGEKDWTIPEEAKGQRALITGCGGGGGTASVILSFVAGYGGSGAYLENKLVTIPDENSIKVTIGGYGGNRCKDGHFYGGGGGCNYAAITVSPLQTLGFGGGGWRTGTTGEVEGTRVGSFFSGGQGGEGGGENGQDGFDIDEDGNKTDYTYGQRAGGRGNDGGNGGVGGYLNDYWAAGGGGGGGGSIGGGGGAGGAGAGGGGGRTVFGDLFIAPGGGGGAAGYGAAFASGGGGGAGKTVDGTGLGGAGGDGAGGFFRHGNGGKPGGANGNDSGPGKISNSIFGDNYCSGGKDGALRVSYAVLGSGGSGGGAAGILPYQKIEITPLEEITTVHGDSCGGGGGVGGEPGGINSSGVFNIGINGLSNSDNQIGRGQNCGWMGIKTTARGEIATTNKGNAIHGGWAFGNPGYMTNIYGGYVSRTGVISGAPGWNTYKKIVSYHGNAAGNYPPVNNNTYNTSLTSTYGNVYTSTELPIGTVGGDGGRIFLFGKDFCTPGAGGTKEHPDGGDAVGPGCGGGGGAFGGNGGRGGGSYIRFSWNKTWDWESEPQKYVYGEAGNGGGGSAGNVFRYSIKVQGGDVLKYKIGKGGMGGYWETVDGVAQKVEATNGGMTELTTANNETLRAGGGLAGAFPMLTTALTNGLGGGAPNLCEFINSSGETESFIDKEKMCTNKAGGNGTAKGGGKGADAGFGAGNGGFGGYSGIGMTSNGEPATGFGGGGGGAGLYDLGGGEAVTAAEALLNPSKGGNGANGKIIFRWK